jgi:hypothetical protein
LAQAVSVLSACGINNNAYNQIEDDYDTPNDRMSDIESAELTAMSHSEEVHRDSLLPLRLESCGTNSTVAPFVRLLAR